MDITDSILWHVWFWHIYFHEEYAEPMAYPRIIFFGGGVQQIQLRTERKGIGGVRVEPP